MNDAELRKYINREVETLGCPKCHYRGLEHDCTMCGGLDVTKITSICPEALTDDLRDGIAREWMPSGLYFVSDRWFVVTDERRTFEVSDEQVNRVWLNVTAPTHVRRYFAQGEVTA